MEQIRGGDADGWPQLVERYQGPLVAFARLNDASEAEDVAQETFLSFLKGLGGFRAEAGLEIYLFGILRRRLVDRYRGRQMAACSFQDTLSGGEDGSSGNGQLAASEANTQLVCPPR